MSCKVDSKVDSIIACDANLQLSLIATARIYGRHVVCHMLHILW
jgi:hypothetical protein